MLNFKEDGVEVCEGIIPKETLKYLAEYTFNQLSHNFNTIPRKHGVVTGMEAHEEYNNLVMEGILSMLTPIIEKKTNLELCPTYSFYRTYFPGNTLRNHKDRSPCEVSVTIMLDNHYSGKEYRWPIISDLSYYKDNKVPPEYPTINPDEIRVNQIPGDGLIYRGTEIPHRRDTFSGEQMDYHTQLFCHFIDKNGPHYPEWKYNSRPGLGFPS